MAFSSSSSCFFTSPNFHTINRQESSSSTRPSSVKYATISANFATAERTTLRTATRIGGSNSLYDVLGIQMGADTMEIKAAYRKLARVLHPDVRNNNNDSSSADEFMKVHSAYATLSDPGKRADYDQTLFGRVRTNNYSSSVGYNSSAGYSGRRWETDQCW